MIKPVLLFATLLFSGQMGISQSLSYPIVDTNVKEYTSNSGLILAPEKGDPYYGQDATYTGNQASYADNGNGSITDLVTGLSWEQDMGEKITWFEAFQKADTLGTGGYDDWRVPSIKELYSLILFTGRVSGATAIEKFIDTEYFNQPLGDPDLGEREIDAQTWSSTQYRGLTMNGDSTVFGVNFVDGRIKGYPKYQPGSNNTLARRMYFRMVRGNPSYGVNDFEDHGDGTITDLATGLMWQQADDGEMRDWESALSYSENLELGGHTDWRLPHAKELQSLVDYTRSPQATASAAIDPLFSTTEIEDPEGISGQYPFFWTGTTHQDGPNPYSSAVYIAFGEAQGLMKDKLMDVHGAGAQRSDPKSGEADDYPQFHGPQGDVRYVYNAVRCVRDAGVQSSTGIFFNDQDQFMVIPNPVENFCVIRTNAMQEEYSLKLYNPSGQLLREESSLKGNGYTLDLSSCVAGVYYICLLSETDSKTLKILKQ